MNKLKWVVPMFLLIRVVEGAATGFFFPVYTPLLSEHGLDEFQMGIVNFFFFTGNWLFDPFTGNLADRFGRRKVYVAGSVFGIIAYLVYANTSIFAGFVTAEITAAIGSALKSEALESWLYDLVGETTQHKIISHSMVLSKLAGIIPSAVAGYLAVSKGLAIGWWLAAGMSVVSLFLAVVIYLYLPSGNDIDEHARRIIPPGVLQVTKLVLRNPKTLRLLIANFVLVMAFMPINMYWPQMYDRLELPVQLRGIMSFVIFVPIMLGSLLTGHNKYFTVTPKGLLRTVVILGVPLLTIGLFPHWSIYLIGLTLHELGRGVINPLIRTIFSVHVKKEYRSTASSIRAASGTLGGSVGLLALGWVTSQYGPTTAWLISGVLISLVAVILYFKR